MTTTCDIEAVEYVPADYFKPLPLEELFPRSAPLEVDGGCGEGAFLAAMAQRHPERNFIGTERLIARVRNCCRKAARLGAVNVRMLRVETAYAVQYLLPPQSTQRIYVLFPDPWPKRRHWPRRLIQPDFLLAAAQALAEGGELCLKTDDADYFDYISAVAKACDRFFAGPWIGAAEMPLTGFERHFMSRGLPIHSLCLTKR